MKVKGAWQFRVTRNSELVVDEEEVENLAHAVRDELVGRGFRPAVRLEIAENCPNVIVQVLLQNFSLPENAVYRINGPVNLNRVTQVYDLVDRPELKFAPFAPRPSRLDTDAPFEQLAERDLLVHHPYDSFGTVLDFLAQAAKDPDVLAIKQTLYRADALRRSSPPSSRPQQNGKQVTTVASSCAPASTRPGISTSPTQLQDVGGPGRLRRRRLQDAREDDAHRAARAGRTPCATCTCPAATTTRARRAPTPTSVC